MDKKRISTAVVNNIALDQMKNPFVFNPLGYATSWCRLFQVKIQNMRNSGLVQEYLVPIGVIISKLLILF